MNEDQKIEEAQYFLDKLTNPDLEHPGFSFELSAFLTAARSALQYALEEARLKTGGQAWYDRQFGAAPRSQILQGQERRKCSCNASHSMLHIPHKVGRSNNFWRFCQCGGQETGWHYCPRPAAKSGAGTGTRQGRPV